MLNFFNYFLNMYFKPRAVESIFSDLILYK